MDLAYLSPFSVDFPDPESALIEPNGLLAVGGDLKPERLLNAYRRGIFPWYSANQPILWWSPDPRAVLFPAELHVSRSLKKSMRKGEFQVQVDRAFSEVIKACAAPRAAETGTWITTEMMSAYETLHHMGVAHSVETYHNGELVGGLYGICIGQLFFGESMFTRATDASKVAFATLARHLGRCGFPLIDCQVPNPHLMSLGAREIPRRAFLTTLATHGDLQPSTDPWKTPWPKPAECL